ncbi:Alpha/beta hydrolase [Azospirillaceae bacterium]
MASKPNAPSCTISPLLIVLVLTLSATGCALGPAGRLEAANTAASTAGFQRLTFSTEQFQLTGWLRKSALTTTSPSVLAVYIEGDGFAWVSKTQLSRDPTPKNPTALRLAMQEPNQNHVLYLGRPCQYSMVEAPDSCDSRYWSSHRFAPEVVKATLSAIEQTRARVDATQIILIGYSGGGAIATLAAAQQPGVVALITVAGVLDHAKWTQHHHVSPLTGSLNPISVSEKLLHVPQTHFVGENDDIVPSTIAHSFLNQRFSPSQQTAPAAKAQIISVPNADHGCCWEKLWPQLRREIALP